MTFQLTNLETEAPRGVDLRTWQWHLGIPAQIWVRPGAEAVPGHTAVGGQGCLGASAKLGLELSSSPGPWRTTA